MPKKCPCTLRLGSNIEVSRRWLSEALRLSAWAESSHQSCQLSTEISPSVFWRQLSSTSLFDQKSTPLWAIEIWPGWGGLPPPTSPASLTE
jgi:hypothetical protein